MTKTCPPDLDLLIGRFVLELHISTPSLGGIARRAVATGYAKGLEGPRLKHWVADAIEDGLGHSGEGLHQHLNEAARADWRGLCSRAFDRALKFAIDMAATAETK